MAETHQKKTKQPPSPVLTEVTGQEILTLKLVGRLYATTTGKTWQKALGLLEQEKPEQVVIDAEGMTYCDLSAVGLLLELKRRQMRAGNRFNVYIHDILSRELFERTISTSSSGCIRLRS